MGILQSKMKTQMETQKGPKMDNITTKIIPIEVRRYYAGTDMSKPEAWPTRWMSPNDSDDLSRKFPANMWGAVRDLGLMQLVCDNVDVRNMPTEFFDHPLVSGDGHTGMTMYVTYGQVRLLLRGELEM